MLLIAMASGISGLLLHVLGRRLEAADFEIARAWDAHVGTDIGRTLRDYCRSAVAVDLLPMAVRPGVASLPVRYRDHSEKYLTVGDLIKEMGPKCGSRTYGDAIRLVRWFYQLEYSLEASQALGDEVLSLLERAVTDNDGSKKVGRIERVKRGQRCDMETMSPVRSGTHVEQPLGFVVYSPENKVISKAEVLCR